MHFFFASFKPNSIYYKNSSACKVMGIKIFFFHYYERKKKVLERYFFLTTYISKVFPETFKCISLRQVVFRSNLQMHSIFILTSNLK